MKVGDWQELRLPFYEPLLAIGAVTLGTASVLAGMVEVVEVAAVPVAFLQMASHTFRPAGGNGEERSFVVSWHTVAELLQVPRPMYSYDFSELGHGWRPDITSLRLTLRRLAILSVTWV